MKRRLGDSEYNLLIVQGNLAATYQSLGRNEEALRLKRDVFSGWLRLKGEEQEQTIRAAYNYANSLFDRQRFEEAKSLLRKTMPVAWRVLRENNDLRFHMRWTFAAALYNDTGATLDDLREAVTTLEDLERVTRRVLGGEQPLTVEVRKSLQNARTALCAREVRNLIL